MRDRQQVLPYCAALSPSRDFLSVKDNGQSFVAIISNVAKFSAFGGGGVDDELFAFDVPVGFHGAINGGGGAFGPGEVVQLRSDGEGFATNGVGA